MESLKKILLYFLLYVSSMSELLVMTIIFYILGMFLSHNNLQENFLVSLMIAGVIGGFWGIGLEKITNIAKNENEELNKSSYKSRFVHWLKMLGIFIIISIILGFLMRWWGMN